MNKMVRMPKPTSITAEELESIRVRRKWSQAEFAERLGLALRTYARYAAGTRKIPLVVAVAARCLNLAK